MLRSGNLPMANAVGVLWAAAMFAWFFLSALYLQLVLGYRPLDVGLAFLPANLIMGAFSLGLSAKLVMRFGIRRPLVRRPAAGVDRARRCLARAPVGGSFVTDVLPSMILLGFGAGLALNPVMLAAMGDVAPEQAGLASGIVNTAFMMGGALGLAVLASVAASRTSHLVAAGHGHLSALTGGYHTAFIIGAGFRPRRLRARRAAAAQPAAPGTPGPARRAALAEPRARPSPRQRRATIVLAQGRRTPLARAPAAADSTWYDQHDRCARSSWD